ncbi:retrovirus-related pol polyprotein from transposon TNT 1-94 [Tanacetum coccineum]
MGKKKLKPDGTVDKFKARLVAKGFKQRENVDFFDTYSPVTRITSIRVLIAFAYIHDLVVHQMDVKTAFLNGELNEEIYRDQPEGFIVHGQEHKVCKLDKSVYGLKQAPKQWHEKFDNSISIHNIKMSNTNLQTQTSNALHNAITEAGGKDRPPMLAPVAEGSSETTTEGYMENYKNVSQDIRDQLNAEAEAVQIILTGIDKDIYSTVDACPNACEMWKAIERLKQGESINVQDLETNLYWEFGKFTSRDGESLESYYSRFYKMMNELVRNQCDVTNHQVNVQFLLKLQPEWQRFVTLVKQSQELKTVSYHKLYDILKQHQNEVNEIRAERLARTANPLALVAQQQPVYHPQNHPNHYTQNSSTRSQQVATRNRGKAIVNSPPLTYDQEPKMVAEDDALSKEKEIDKLMALISLSFKKIYKPTNNNLKTSSNTSRANQDVETRRGVE